MTHLEGILKAVVTGAANAWAEDFNTMIQKIKRDTRGFETRNGFQGSNLFSIGWS